MQNFKNRLYNYEADPPGQIWQNINLELISSDPKVISIKSLRKRSKLIFYGITAAASLILIFIISLLFHKSQKNQSISSIAVNQSQNISSKQVQDSLNLNDKILKDIINSTENKNLLALNYENSSGNGKKYLTIAGPECEPVKISPKVATLIESTDDGYPPKPIWNKKIERWKQIMLSSTLSPTSTNLLDIMQLSSNDNN